MNEAWFFVGLLVFILVVWFALGGPARGLSFNFPTVSYTSSYASSSSASASSTGGVVLPQAPFGIGRTDIHLPDVYEGIGDGTSGGSDTGGSATVEPLVKVPGVAYPTLSPYRGRVRLDGSVANASSSDATKEYVRISLADDRGPSVDITGWQLASGATYANAYIPRGTLLPASGAVNPTSDIVLDPGDSAIIVSGTSPVGGSFRENKCTGYFGSVQTFTPSLASNCPSAADELASYYGRPYIHDPACIDYANTLSRCRIPFTTSKLTFNCREFLDTYMNYPGCVAAHKNDADFSSDTWRIYLGRSKKNHLWRDRHEVVELLDKSGRIVDAFTY